MESHVLQYESTEINIEIKGLDENSYIFYPEAGTTKKIDAKGIEVNKLAKEANTNIGMVQRDSNNTIITSSSSLIKNLLPFEYFADSTTSLSLMETIDKKMINGIMKTYWKVFVFDSSGNYIEPVNFDLTSDSNSIDINILCGYSYNDLQYAIKKDDDAFGNWINFSGPIFKIDSLTPGDYSIKVQSAGTTLNEIFTRFTTIY